MEALLTILQKTEAYFLSKGVPQARLDAELLLAHVLDCRRLDLYLQHDRPLSSDLLDELRPLVARRGKREPLQYITGETDWMAFRIRCDRRALIPRSETEELAEAVVSHYKDRPPPRRILDLGTGSGVLALAMAKAFDSAEVVAVDASAEALALAHDNATNNGLAARIQFLQSNWFSEISESFDCIVSNPPYLTDAEWQSAEPEVQHWEPKSALVSANQGMADLLSLIKQAASRLTPSGLLALETGIAQHPELVAACETSGSYAPAVCLKDLSKRPRFLLATRQ